MKNLNCDYCNFCDFCNSCDFCDFCTGCYDCKNLVNGFRCSKVKLAEQDENRYWIFNKEVSKEEWDKRYELKVVEEGKFCQTCGKQLE